MGEIWKAIVGVLISGGPLLAVQLGGRRGLMRRAIREDLELIRLLDAEHTEVSSRIRRRVETKLEQYEPGESARKRRRRGVVLAVLEFAALTAIAVVTLMLLDVESAWTSSSIGAVLGVLGAVVHLLVTSRLDRREQDLAVAEVRLDATRQRRTAHFEARTDPAPTDRGE